MKKSTMFIRKSDADIKVLNVGLVSRLNGLAVGSTIKNRRVTPYVGDCLKVDIMERQKFKCISNVIKSATIKSLLDVLIPLHISINNISGCPKPLYTLTHT